MLAIRTATSTLESIRAHDIEPMKADIQLRETKSNFEELLERFNVFSGVENIKNFREIYEPKIKEFTENIEKLYKDNQDVKNCIIQFDTDLSLKSNKSQLLAIEHDFGQKFLGVEMMSIIDMKLDLVEKTLKYQNSHVYETMESYKDKMNKLIEDLL